MNCYQKTIISVILGVSLNTLTFAQSPCNTNEDTQATTCKKACAETKKCNKMNKAEKKHEGMVVTSTGIVNGVIADKYGKHGTQFNEKGMPTYSLPLKIENAPKGTVSYAICLEDKDAFPVSGGFSWIHWTAANITKTELKENESQTASDFVQGVNSWMSMQGGKQSKALSSFYGGMAPPDAEHVYEIHVYALDCLLDLENGFLMNDMYRKMEGHILDSYTLKGSYRN